MKVLVIDIGGTHVKVASTENPVPVKIVSGSAFTPQQLAAGVLAATDGWEYDAVTIGYPGPVRHDRPAAEPHNLGTGWMKFNFQGEFPKPVRFLNDAAMQALGGYKGGSMLFLGIGTGLGSALVVDHLVVPLELAHLPYRKGHTYEEYIGLEGLQRRGKKRWRESVVDVVTRLRAAFVVDYVLLGGGNAKLMRELPEGVQVGANSNAITGGIALWEGRNVAVVAGESELPRTVMEEGARASKEAWMESPVTKKGARGEVKKGATGGTEKNVKGMKGGAAKKAGAKRK